MIRSARSRDWNFCLCVLHNAKSGNTVGILNGLQEEEIEKLLFCMKQSQNEIRDPMLLPIFLLELKVHFFAKLLEKRALGLDDIEHATGMRHGFSDDPRRNALIDKERRELAKQLDFDPITQKLTGVTGTLSFCDMTFLSSKRALDAVSSFREDYQLAVGSVGACHQSEPAALTRRAQYLYQLIQGSISHSTVLSARTKAQIQTVYSMIGQRDNRVNIETATMSQKIATLARRDSLDMRIIAAVTLVFLPGTFVATMFGSGFFKFFPEGSSRVVSSWIWVYWVLTIGITMIVLMFWWIFARKRSQALFDVEHGPKGANEARRYSTRHGLGMDELHTTMSRGIDGIPSPRNLNMQLSHSSGIEIAVKS